MAAGKAEMMSQKSTRKIITPNITNGGKAWEDKKK